MLLQYPTHSVPMRIIGVDPGTNTLGVAVIDLDLQTGQRTLIDARTFDVTKNQKDYHNLFAVHGDSEGRLQMLEDALVNYFNWFQPHVVISESPFLRARLATAFRALTLCLSRIRQALIRHDRFKPLHLSDPMTVKAAVGVHSKVSKNKDALGKDKVKEAVMMQDILNPGGIDLSELDEHSIDAIAVACSRIVAMYQP